MDELGEGETMVLTLADRRMLDERGRNYAEDAEEDELENVLKVCLCHLCVMIRCEV